MEAQTITVDAGRRAIDAELYLPAETPRPGILLLHELFGLDSQVRADARDLARAGYVVLVPDLYSGGVGMRRYCVRMMFSAATLTNRGDTEQIAEVNACMDRLARLPECDGKLGVLGMCLTGGFALHMARRDDVSAPVVYHHSFGVRGSGISDADASEIDTRVQGHFGGDDRVLCPRARVEALSRQLGDKLEINTYPGTGHGLRSAFRYTPAGEEAWRRTLVFFAEQLG